MEDQTFVLCENLVKIYKVAELEVVALQGLDLVVETGEMMALVGPSGAGKSTLLNVIGGLDTPSAGTVMIGGWDLLKMKERDRMRYKREVVGFAWQQPARNLLPYLTVRENIELPMLVAGQTARKRRARVDELLEVVGLSEQARHKPDQLSGGQQQRVALAVALANNPPLLLGDELTGQIDSQSAQQVYEALRKINETFRTTVILVTHDPMVARLVNRVVAIRDGRTSTEIRRRHDVESGKMHEEEWVVLDKAGRLQLPKPYVEKLNLRERVKVRLEETHVAVWPQHKAEEFVQLQAVEAELPATVAPQQRPRRGPVVATQGVWRTFDLGAEQVHAVRAASLAIPAGKMVVVKGRSGSGKTTLLNLIAGLDEPTKGSVAVGGKLLSKLSLRQRVELRRRHIGFVFQTFGLLPFLSVEENVGVPMRLVRELGRSRRQRVTEVLRLVGLTGRAHHRTYELSGGEQQRVAIARALVNRPYLILADEPTGQLDTATGMGIIQLLRDIVDRTGVTVVVASHDPLVWQAADLIYEMRDGEIVSSPEAARTSG
jgi:peptide/nickel transport system ATP-binding protein